MIQGPFTTQVHSKYLLVTEIGCIPSTSSLSGRGAPCEATPEPTTLFIRGAKPQTLTTSAQKDKVVHAKPIDHLKRQVSTNTAGSPSTSSGEFLRLAGQLFTVMYTVVVINSGGDLAVMCLQLQSANAMLDLAGVGINATQAAAIVCPASLRDSDLSSFNQTLIFTATVGLYGLQLAANYTGTVSTVKLCSQLDLSLLPALGVDTFAVQTFICGANNATSTISDTIDATTIAPSVGSLTPFPFTNSSEDTFTWFGTGTGTGLAGSAVTTPRGTGFPASGTGFHPTGNVTAVAGSSGAGSAGFGTGAVPTSISNVTVIAGRPDFDPAASGNAPFPTGNVNVSTITGSAGSGTAGFGTGLLPTDTGSVQNGTVAFGTDVLPAGTGNVENNTTAFGTGGLATGTGSIGNSTTNFVTGIRPTGTGDVGNATAAFGTGDPAAATGNSGPGTNINGTDDASEGDGIEGPNTSISATGVASDGYALATVDPSSNLGGYGEDTTERIPRGPTSTPRYYPKYF